MVPIGSVDLPLYLSGLVFDGFGRDRREYYYFSWPLSGLLLFDLKHRAAMLNLSMMFCLRPTIIVLGIVTIIIVVVVKILKISEEIRSTLRMLLLLIILVSHYDTFLVVFESRSHCCCHGSFQLLLGVCGGASRVVVLVHWRGYRWLLPL